MDPVKNPYTPNAGSRPPELAGRDEQLEQFRILVARLKSGQTDQSIIAKGLRGVGKTVLLNAFEDMAESEGFLTYYHELTDETSLIEELARDAERAIRGIRGVDDRFGGADGHLAARVARVDGIGARLGGQAEQFGAHGDGGCGVAGAGLDRGDRDGRQRAVARNAAAARR